MQILVLYLISILITYYAAWLRRPDYVEGFISAIPNVTWEHIGLELILVNYTILCFGLLGVFNKNTRSNFALVSGGLIASATIASFLSLSFVFNILWSVITPKYLLLLIIIVYATNLGWPLLVYGIKESESDQSTEFYDAANLLSQIRGVLSEIEQQAIRSNSPLQLIHLTESVLKYENQGVINFSAIEKNITAISQEIELPRSLAMRVDLLIKEIQKAQKNGMS